MPSYLLPSLKKPLQHQIYSLTILHSERPKLQSFGFSECSRVKSFGLSKNFGLSECNRVKSFVLSKSFGLSEILVLIWPF